MFKRVDRWSGDTRYIYHGNDGTSFPWNDTAQLDYLRADVREAVIRTIIDVARRFPVIRFDAAMVLARKHVQRLWYPLPGSGGAIPSRAESSLTQAAFDAAMPAEFWREVVDRVAVEAPDTLLLAEAFWLLEGYFVRTLGMHRVYNSAFMHMLRDEDNAGYRSVIRETVAFDPRILGRYVNFMNNPDERTAIDQFGSGDKYIGVATLLATLPGLPMFGHGQVEGFGEKYGMEFRRAMLDERPDQDLVARHEREAVPVAAATMAIRGRGRLPDAGCSETRTAIVDEDVFAYANEVRGSRSLVVYRNQYLGGPVRIAGAGEALGLPDDASTWLVVRDARTRPGAPPELSGRPCQRSGAGPPRVSVPRVPGPMGGPGRPCGRLGTTGLAHRTLGRARRPGALQDQLLEPARLAVDSLFLVQTIRDVAGAGLAPSEATATALVESALEALEAPLGACRPGRRRDRRPWCVGGTRPLCAGRATHGPGVGRSRWEGGCGARPQEVGPTTDDRVRLARWLGTDRARWATLVDWAVGASLGDLVGASTPGAMVGVYDAWAADSAVSRTATELDLDEVVAARVAGHVRALLAVPVGALDGDRPAETLAGWLEAPAVRATTAWNEWQGADIRVPGRRWPSGSTLSPREMPRPAPRARSGLRMRSRQWVAARQFQVGQADRDESAWVSHGSRMSQGHWGTWSVPSSPAAPVPGWWPGVRRVASRACGSLRRPDLLGSSRARVRGP